MKYKYRFAMPKETKQKISNFFSFFLDHGAIWMNMSHIK